MAISIEITKVCVVYRKSQTDMVYLSTPYLSPYTHISAGSDLLVFHFECTAGKAVAYVRDVLGWRGIVETLDMDNGLRGVVYATEK